MKTRLSQRTRTNFSRFGVMGLLAITLMVSARPASATSIDLDLFFDPNPGYFVMVPAGTNPSHAHTDVAASIIGGQRDSLFEVFGEGVINSAVGLIGYDSDDDMYAFQLGTIGLAPTAATILYNGVGGVGLDGIDLTGGGMNDRIEMSFVTSDALPTTGLDVKLTITGPGGSSTATVIAPNSQSAFVLTIPFNQLVGGADPNDVDSIKFEFNSIAKTANIDFELNRISAVPEPAGLLTVALGGVLVSTFSMARRRYCR